MAHSPYRTAAAHADAEKGPRHVVDVDEWWPILGALWLCSIVRVIVALTGNQPLIGEPAFAWLAVMGVPFVIARGLRR